MSELYIQRQQQGLAEQFKVYVLIENGRNEVSSEYNIDNLVIIRFIIEGTPNLIISTKTYGEVHAVNINVTCTKNSDSAQWFCTDRWSENLLHSEPVNSYISQVVNSSHTISTTYDFGLINVIARKMIMMPLIYEDEIFTDFRLSTVDGSVGVHKASLAAHSDMFKAMLNGEWKETMEGRIEVEGASLQTLQALKDFMYLGKLPDEGLQTLLQIAIRFFIESLKKECIIKLAQHAKPEEYLELLDFARDKEIVELTFALVQLTPKEVINSAYRMMIKSKQLPEAGDKTDK